LLTTKQVVGWLVVLFVIFFIVTQPNQAADIAHNLWDLIVNVYHGVADFVVALS
jgi:hypothetical protein